MVIFSDPSYQNDKEERKIELYCD